jgi:hypothetical protein
LGFVGDTGDQAVAPGMHGVAARRHFLGVLEDQNTQRRIEAQIGLAHRGTEGEAELFELAESR